MQISSRFTIAIHIFSCIDTFGDQHKITSDFLADSVNVNPVTIRNILGQLKAAKLVTVKRGSGGTSIARPLKDISLLDIFHGVESIDDQQLFHIHESPNPGCPVGKNIHLVLGDKLDRVQSAMEKELAKITLEDIKKDMQSLLKR